MIKPQKVFSIPLNPHLNEIQFGKFIDFLHEQKEYIRDVYFTSRISPFDQDAMGDSFENSDDLINNALVLQQHTGIKVSATFNNIQVRPDQSNLDLFIKNFKPLYNAGIHSATIPHGY